MSFTLAASSTVFLKGTKVNMTAPRRAGKAAK
jgi:hypothetical protein